MSKSYNVGKNNGMYKHGVYSGKYYCIDCGKRIRPGAKRCGACYNKIRQGKLRGAYKREINYCIDCGKEISYRAKRCYNCNMLFRWKNKVYRENTVVSMFRGMKLSPNKCEKLLNALLNKLLPNEYKFIGNGKLIIDGLCPDFVNCNGQKKIIELFGDYWHNRVGAKQRDKRRIKIYDKYGYKTLIIWEHELKDKNNLKKKILVFNKGVL